MKKAEKDLEESLLWETMFELGLKGSIGSRQTENGMGCACTKPSVGRKAWSGGSWQLGLGIAVSYHVAEAQCVGLWGWEGAAGGGADCFINTMS